MALRCVIHCHTKYSPDSSWKITDVITECQKKRIDVIAITDHDTIDGALAVQASAPKNLHVIIGQEISTAEGDLIGLYLNTVIAPQQSIIDTIAEIRRQNGIVILPHPFDRLRRHAVGAVISEAVKSDIDLIETFNARCLFSADNQTAEQFAKDNHLTGIAAADAHFASELTNAICMLDNCDSSSSFLQSVKQVQIETQAAGLHGHFKSALVKIVGRIHH